MNCTALILVEGIPGSGKTSTARRIAQWLGDHGYRPRLHLEGDSAHPADFESVARLTSAEWRALLDAYPASRPRLCELAWTRGRETFVPYGRLVEPPEDLLSTLARRDVYQLPLADWQRLTLSRWVEFARGRPPPSEVWVFECCFLQNLLTTALARFDQPPELAAAHVLAVAEVLRPLHALLVYLDPPSVADCLDAVAAQRPPEWLEFVAAYTAGQAWGQARGLSGRSGMLRFYQERRDLEAELCPALRAGGMDITWLSDAGRDWGAAHAVLTRALCATFTASDRDGTVSG